MKACILMCFLFLFGNHAFSQSNLSVKSDFPNLSNDSTITPAFNLIDGTVISSSEVDSLNKGGNKTNIEVPTRRSNVEGDVQGSYYFLKPNEDK